LGFRNGHREVSRVFKNYFIVTLRNLRRTKGYSFINIFGLALSLGLGLLLIQMIINFMSYDRFQANKDRIYRVNTWRSGEGKADDYASTPLPIASALLRESPGIEAVTQWAPAFGGNAVCRGKILPLSAYFADSDFFRVFSFKLDHGDPASALREPNSIVLSSKVAEMFFGTDSPVGQVIQFGKWGDYKITGVLADTSRLKSHIEVRSLISLSTLASLETQKLLTPRLKEWADIVHSYTYVMLKPLGSPAAVEEAANLAAADDLDTSKFKYRFWLQPLTGIVPGATLRNHIGNDVPWGAVYVCAAIALLVVLSAAFNYTNLSIARALSRAREVGIRKVVGAKRRQLFVQFIGEAVVIALLAFAAGFVLYRVVLIPLLQGLDPALRSFFLFRETWATLGFFLAFAAGTGVVAGAIPALHISRFQPIQALRNLAGLRVVSRITTRKALIVFQFGLSSIFIISTFVAIDQLRFIQTVDLGFRAEGTIRVPLQGVDFDVFRQRIAQEPGIVAVSGTEILPGVGEGGTLSPLTRPDASITEPVLLAAADAGFLPLFGVRLLAGSNFPETAPPAGETLLIVNETAARKFAYGSPEKAVNQSLSMKDGKTARIIGVVKDFAHSSITDEQGAFALSYRPEMFGFAILRVDRTGVKSVAERLQRIWASFDSAAPFEYAVLTDLIEDRLGGMKAMMRSIRFVSVLAVVVACLGLLGISDYSSRIRRREVGVRKVCGAGEWSLVKLLSRSYLAMLTIAAGAAVPVAWWFNKLILTLYDRAVALRPELFIAGPGIVAALGMAVVLSQTIRAARANPADIIRHE
jgi:putative ABC transport system permease protein